MICSLSLLSLMLEQVKIIYETGIINLKVKPSVKYVAITGTVESKSKACLVREILWNFY
ncbi:hypothetical protein HanXRQr2_Chr14g0654721 [Helianthus annuus]|uniref:Uncharacterized protein n=1 Tax=Helianthus annuus TaxID=4232 RepID=A0A9K3H8I5_HELAN|nr:hypothetical protein HanXRQr2_Chr14g0654721 [Helianthus annuus]KAJ0464956.1 hypothetical protein HanHA300_Chr14g0533091 [Helianthus annuus]KAJ0486549.1 hypothetical protein HanHA89_Chr14g0580911 [Helianthus annuus]KAJ0657115.1 hypothetical protein HanLR1_Chr14g0543491 [Helianthus annuus]KAJ0660694.1 hypothetical protein HanOQP8_Chr14g0540621 [Helianthus annuus]